MFYLYTDHKTEISAEVKAENILEADEIYQLHTGVDPKKASHIGCSIHKTSQLLPAPYFSSNNESS